MDGLSFKKGVRSEKIVIINPLAQKKKNKLSRQEEASILLCRPLGCGQSNSPFSFRIPWGSISCRRAGSQLAGHGGACQLCPQPMLAELHRS